MQYPTLTIDEGRSVLEHLRSGSAANYPSPRWMGSGPKRFDETLVDDLVESVTMLRRTMGEPSEGGKRYWARFEGRAAAQVHEALEELPMIAAVDPGFWIWLVFGSKHDGPAKLVTWRHGRDTAKYDALDANYGLTTALEGGFWSRLWLRGEVGRDDTRSDPYELALRGDQDLWRSHIFKIEYGSVRRVAHALLTFQYPDCQPDKARVPVKVIREMAKEIRRRHAIIAFELLDEAAAKRLIDEVHDTVTAR